MTLFQVTEQAEVDRKPAAVESQEEAMETEGTTVAAAEVPEETMETETGETPEVTASGDTPEAAAEVKV